MNTMSIRITCLNSSQVMLNEVHSNWYKMVESSDVYYHTKFDRNQAGNVQSEINMYFFFLK